MDVLIPSALEAQIDAATVNQISERVRLIAEGANGPTTPQADRALQERGIFMIPDFLCNAGGVLVSYFESVQNNINYYWSREEVLEKLERKLSQAFDHVLQVAEGEGVYMRDAAYMLSINRVVAAMELRGWLFVP